ncbi:uncharacterized protein PAC_06353 [Phialocephala subalpina]|uniref:Heterokaryon incompatibility domain-containing protein n=1 Tax=Phialocephala subalpina TaxID=576137 RepID=A0A1L7WUK6_9HELO|nr:uncharacterized protein PAC_06353 [Phialocephala subalpina]
MAISCTLGPRSLHTNYNHQSQHEALWRTLVVDNGNPMTSPASPSMEYNYRHIYLKLRMTRRGFFNDSMTDPEVGMKYSGASGMIFGLQDPDFKVFFQASSFIGGYKFGILGNTKWFCLVPEATIVGDMICVIRGIDVPFVMRADKEEGVDKWIIVGPCFAHGLMDGDLAEEGERRGNFELVDVV